MAWLAVDKDGQELICINRPIRSGYVERSSIYGRPYFERPEEWEYDKIKEFTFWDRSEESSFCNDSCNWIIYLPKGSIKKLIGKELSWDDEPVKLK